jgi:hypothetical protein
MNEGKAQLLKEASPVFKERGWKNKGATWLFKSSEGFVVVFNLQKSAWGDAYYLNYGVFLPDSAPSEPRPEYEADIFGRCDGVLTDDSAAIRSLKYEPQSKTAANQMRTFLQVLRPENLKRMEYLASNAGLRRFLSTPTAKQSLKKPDLLKRLEQLKATTN